MKNTLTEFRQFLLRGNVVDLAVAVVIGGAFGLVVAAFVRDIITPILGIFGGFDFSSDYLEINHSRFLYGDFINVVISFVCIAAAIFFFVVKPMNHIQSMRKTEPTSGEITKECPYCVSSIPGRASKCAFCGSEVPVSA